MPKIKLSSFLKNIVSTTVTSFAVTIALIFVTRFLAKGFGPEEFGAYSLARRVIANIAPLVILSMGVALRRYAAMSNDKRIQGTYIISSLLATGTILFIFLVAAGCASNKLSCFIFHSKEYLGLYYSSLFFICCYTIWVITCSFLFGMQKIGRANILQLLIGAVLPLFIAYAFADTKSSAEVLAFIGAAHLISLFVLIAEILKTKWMSFKEIKTSLTTLLKYGIPRTPGGFAFAGLFTIGPFLASCFGNLKDAGFFVIGQYVFRIMETAIAAFGLVALPKIAQLLARGNDEYLKTNIENLLIMIFHLGLFATIHTFLWSKEVLLVWLGFDYLEAVPVMKLLILSLAPYLGYVMLRSVVDAIEVRAINTLNLFVSLSVAFIVSIILEYAGLEIIGLAIGSTIGFATLGILTGFYLVKRYSISFDNFMFCKILLINSVLAVIAIIVKQSFVAAFSQYNLLITGFLIEALLFSSYLYYLYKKDVSWALGIKRRIIQG